MLLYEDIISILINYLKVKIKVKFRLLNKDYLYVLETYEWKYDIRENDNYALRFACDNGHLETFKYLVEKFNLTIEDVRTYDNYALRWVCGNGHLETVKYIVNKFDIKQESLDFKLIK